MFEESVLEGCGSLLGELGAGKTLAAHLFSGSDDDPARQVLIEAVAFHMGGDTEERWRWEVVLHDVLHASENTTRRLIDKVLPRFGAVREAGLSALKSVVIGRRDTFLHILNPVSPPRRFLASQRITIQVLLADFEKQLWKALRTLPCRERLLRFYGNRADRETTIDAAVAAISEVLRGPDRDLHSMIVLASMY